MTFSAISSRRRWSDNDRHFGPLTFARAKDWRPLAVVLSSGSAERESPGCSIRFQALGFTAICELPQIVKPWRRWVDLTGKEWANSNGYWDEHPREYGVSLNDGFLQVFFGAQTMDSSTTQDWTCFLPWTQWRQIAHRLYNADDSMAGDVAQQPWDRLQTMRDGLSKCRFKIIDYDGEQIEVETYVEEREWRRGVGLFRWLGYVTPKKRCRSLDIKFKSEVGPEKGSWKGGMVGHGIDMRPGETQQEAFVRYCDDEHRSKYRKYRVAFAGAVSQEG